MPAANLEVNPYTTPAPPVPACSSTLCMAFKKYLDDKFKREHYIRLTHTDPFKPVNTLLDICNVGQTKTFPILEGADFEQRPAKCNCGCVAFSVRLYYGDNSPDLRADIETQYPFFEHGDDKAHLWYPVCMSYACHDFREFFANFFTSHTGRFDSTAICSCGYLESFFYPHEEPVAIAAEEPTQQATPEYPYDPALDSEPEAEPAQVVPSRKRKSDDDAKRSTRSKK